MRHSLLPLIIGFTLGIQPGSADPVVDFRLLKTDPATAGFIRKALADGTVQAAGMEDRLEQLGTSGKVKELARFQREFSPEGGTLNFKKDTSRVTIADGELMPVGILLEAEPHIGPSGLVDLRFAFDHSVSIRKNRINTARTMGGSSAKPGEWEIISDWGNDAETSLLMVNISGIEATPEARRPAPPIREVFCRSEVRLCDPGDLRKFERSTPATRAKAVDWLKGRGTPLATSGLRLRPGEKVVQQEIIQWIHDDNGWGTAELGLTLELEGTIGPFGKLIDLRLAADWHPRNAKRPPEKAQSQFVLAETTSSGSTFVVEAKPRPDDGPVPVMFVTPEVHTIHEGTAPTVPAPRSKMTQKGIRTYLVHPALIRKLAQSTNFNPAPVGGVVPRPRLQELLKQSGMNFPPGTRASFHPSSCTVMLNQNPEAHVLFKAILTKLELSIEGAPAN